MLLHACKADHLGRCIQQLMLMSEERMVLQILPPFGRHIRPRCTLWVLMLMLVTSTWAARKRAGEGQYGARLYLYCSSTAL